MCLPAWSTSSSLSSRGPGASALLIEQCDVRGKPLPRPSLWMWGCGGEDFLFIPVVGWGPSSWLVFWAREGHRRAPRNAQVYRWWAGGKEPAVKSSTVREGSSVGVTKKEKCFGGMGGCSSGCSKHIVYNNIIITVAVLTCSVTNLKYNNHSCRSS